jgi:predicted transcriptional regulator of viral defense system
VLGLQVAQRGKRPLPYISSTFINLCRGYVKNERMTSPKDEQVLALVRAAGVLRPRDLEPRGIPRQHLQRLYERGLVERVGRGLYIAADAEPTEHHSLAQAAKRVPQGVICLLSALQYHSHTTQMPFEVWIAVERTAWKPTTDDVPLRVVRFSGEAFTAFVEEHEIEGVQVRVYTPAKTVADCFKYRNKIGLDVALEALRDTWKQQTATMDELWSAAGVCRVQKVMKPYLESLT